MTLSNRPLIFVIVQRLGFLLNLLPRFISTSTKWEFPFLATWALPSTDPGHRHHQHVHFCHHQSVTSLMAAYYLRCSECNVSSQCFSTFLKFPTIHIQSTDAVNNETTITKAGLDGLLTRLPRCEHSNCISSREAFVRSLTSTLVSTFSCCFCQTMTDALTICLSCISGGREGREGSSWWNTVVSLA